MRTHTSKYVVLETTAGRGVFLAARKATRYACGRAAGALLLGRRAEARTQCCPEQHRHFFSEVAIPMNDTLGFDSYPHHRLLGPHMCFQVCGIMATCRAERKHHRRATAPANPCHDMLAPDDACCIYVYVCDRCDICHRL